MCADLGFRFGAMTRAADHQEEPISAAKHKGERAERLSEEPRLCAGRVVMACVATPPPQAHAKEGELESAFDAPDESARMPGSAR